MKKILFLMIFAVTCSLKCMASYSATCTRGDFEYSITSSDYKNFIVSCRYHSDKGVSGLLYYPDSVVYDGRTWYVSVVSGCSGEVGGITKVRLPSCTRTIGPSAFSGCTNLREIIMPSSLTIIRHGAFSNCISLSEFKLPDRVKTLEPRTFKGCTGLTKVELHDSLETIGDEAFMGCTRLKEMTLPKGLTSIKGSAFGGCSRLTTITVDSACTAYDSRNGCNAVMETGTNILISGCKSTIIPDETTEIGDSAFCGARCPDSISLPQSVKTIGLGAFEQSNLIKIKLPRLCKTICNRAFYASKSLRDVEIPQNSILSTIGVEAFTSCSNLQSFTIPSYVREIPLKTFASCTNMTSITFESGSGLTTIGEEAFEYSGIRSLILPKSLRLIGYDAFRLCRNLEMVILPEGLTRISSNSFEGCTNLKTVSFPKTLTDIRQYAFSECSNLQTITLPEALTAIGAWAFYKCSNLQSVSFPKALTSIGKYAFYLCSSLDSVGIDCDNITIGEFAFEDCTSLRALFLPENGYTAYGIFMSCTNLKHVYNQREVAPSVPESIFYNVNKGKCNLYVPMQSVEDYKETDVWCDFNIIGMEFDGVSDVVTDHAAATPVGYYDLAGRRLSGAQQGVNIVRYSDGTSRKVVVR